MIEICPAGPPKLIKPNLNQKKNASQKLIEGGVDVVLVAGATSV
jgi:hypothetical protein